MMASEGNQIDGGLAIAHGIPLLVVAEKNILKRGILDEGAAEYGIVDMNTKDPTFKSQVAEWCEKVKARPRVFLGYCGKAQETAEKLIGFLQQHEVSVREYKMDFVLGSTILDQIDRAARGLRPVFERRVFLFATRTVSPHTHGSSLITLGGFARSRVFESAS